MKARGDWTTSRGNKAFNQFAGVKWWVINNHPSNDGLVTWLDRYDGVSLSSLDSQLREGHLVIAEVKENGGHFVVVTGRREGAEGGAVYDILDPGYANRTTLDAYGNKFVGLRVYGYSRN